MICYLAPPYQLSKICVSGLGTYLLFKTFVLLDELVDLLPQSLKFALALNPEAEGAFSVLDESNKSNLG